MRTDTSTITYPDPAEVDEWLESIWTLASATSCPAEILPEAGFTHQLSMHHLSNAYVRFEPEGMAAFYGYWQTTWSAPAPLVVHVPGYGAEISAHPEIVAAGYNVLHISPLGYSTPGGADLAKQRNGEWPVLPDTILTDGREGYRHWLANCAMAVIHPDAVHANKVGNMIIANKVFEAVVLASPSITTKVEHRNADTQWTQQCRNWQADTVEKSHQSYSKE